MFKKILKKCLDERQTYIEALKIKKNKDQKALSVKSITCLLEFIHLNPGNVLEVGTGYGISAFTMALCMKLLKRDDVIYSMDLKVSRYSTSPGIVKRHLLAPFLEFLRIDKNTRPFNKKVKLLIIDGEHSHKATKHDYNTFSPLVEPGGMIFFDNANMVGVFGYLLSIHASFNVNPKNTAFILK